MSYWLSHKEVTAYVHLTTPTIADELSSIGVPAVEIVASQELYAAGMNFAGLPAALMVVQRNKMDKCLSIVSLAVSPPLRYLGLARQLLNWLIDEAKRMGCSRVDVSYPLNHSATEAMQHLTKPALGWQHSQGMRLVSLDPKTAFPIILERLNPLADRWLGCKRWTLVPFKDLNAHQLLEVETLQQQAPQWAWPEMIETQELLGKFDKDASQVLLDNGEVAGWLIAHRVGTSLFRVTKWWLAPQFQGSGVSLLLLRHALVNALEAIPSYSSASFGYAVNNQSMKLISRRLLEPLARSIQDTEKACIVFQQEHP